jgi:hypothetical protein
MSAKRGIAKRNRAKKKKAPIEHLFTEERRPKIWLTNRGSPSYQPDPMQSAGMPGNEEADPPIRPQTPGERWRQRQLRGRVG